MFKGKIAALTVVAVLTTFGSSKAAVIDRSFTTTATFDQGPNSIITFNYDVSFDPTNASTPTLNSFSSSVQSEPFTEAAIAGRALRQGINELLIGNGFGAFSYGTNQFDIVVNLDQQGNVGLTDEGRTSYSFSGAPSIYGSSVQISLEAPSLIAGSVPEPSTWAMMLVGFGGLGFLAYRKSRERDALSMMAA